MDIANRKQKKYPEKLFIELCILFLLIDSGNDVELFVLSNLFRKSLKTYKRYAEELSQCGITPELSLRMIDGERRFFFDCWDRGDYDIDQLLPEYISEHFHEEKCSDRLYRCGYMLAKSPYSLQRSDDLDEDEYVTVSDSDKVEYDGREYCFFDFDKCDELYKKTSLRTQQRDVRIVKDVLVKMKGLMS